ncbi:MAG: hypothetical protein KJ620_03330 [Candidatus Edwardsbacteria bacterium]|nr:hypothetical protein [Candidatus Edwardsbacteria bacterium]MBU1577132.1 hypothetical protein [Candidatus Edwardsbacteria bacterium]MBU2463790.1 hypothetical protein [Candidatus Edwardsbacteria bacterium]MBU2593772.1 hypothetical protein [Candidatus Edwardsbacteria bacterium]
MKTTGKITLLVALSFFTAFGSARAGLLEYTPYGSPASSYNAIGMAMNLKGVALPGQGLLVNPALIAETDGLEAQLTAGVNWRREYRSIEVFDSYANSVGLRTTAINDQTDYNLHGAEVSYASSFRGLPKMALGFGLSREYDFNYRLKAEERDAFYYLTSLYEQIQEGAVYGYSGALAVKPLSFFSAGLGLTRLSGDPRLTITENFEDPTYTDISIGYQHNYKGYRFSAGAFGQLTSRINLGISWKSSARVEGLLSYSDNDTSISQNQKVGLPSSFTLGATYRPSNEFPATVCLEYEHTPWQNLEDNLFSYEPLVPVNKYSFGISHRMKNNLPLYFGVSFTNSYRSSSIGLARAGFGTEILVSNLRSGISAGVGRRTYNYGQAFGTSSGTTVSETMADLMLTFSLK